MLSVEAWVGIVALLFTVIGGIVYVERRMGKALTREEHERICQERNTRVEKQLDGLRQTFEDKHQENRQTDEETKEFLRDIVREIRANEERRSRTEHEIRDSVNVLVTRVAVNEVKGIAR
jgi:type III secretory pathway component EscR